MFLDEDSGKDRGAGVASGPLQYPKPDFYRARGFRNKRPRAKGE